MCFRCYYFFMIRMTLRLDDPLYRIIKERALREHRSAHAEILVVLESFFAEFERTERRKGKQ